MFWSCFPCSLSKLFGLVTGARTCLKDTSVFWKFCLCQEPLVQNAPGSLAWFWGTGINSGDYKEKCIFYIAKPAFPSTGPISFHFPHSLIYAEVDGKQLVMQNSKWEFSKVLILKIIRKNTLCSCLQWILLICVLI